MEDVPFRLASDYEEQADYSVYFASDPFTTYRLPPMVSKEVAPSESVA